MTIGSTKITGYFIGDDLTVRRNVTTTQALTKAWLTVMASLTDADDDAVVQKIITTTGVGGTGEIEDAGLSGTAVIRFDLSPTDTRTISTVSRRYDIQVQLADGKIATVEWGTIVFRPEATKATS